MAPRVLTLVRDVGAYVTGAPNAGASSVGAPDVSALDAGAHVVGAHNFGAHGKTPKPCNYVFNPMMSKALVEKNTFLTIFIVQLTLSN